MENEKQKVKYTLEQHFDAGLFDYSDEEWEKQKETHEGFLHAWSQETRIGATGQDEIVPVGIIEDVITHEIRTIPINRITIIK